MSKKLTFTILSISLLTVMAGAAVAPALGVIQQHFSEESPLLIRFIVSLPALFIILVNLLFTQLTRFLRTRTIALIGLTMYVVCGVGAFFATDITSLLVIRALIGVSVGLIMPLSTGLLAYYYPPEEMGRLMGLSAAMNQMGGVVATLLAGYLATIAWNYAFLVYALGLLAIVLVLLFLPNEQLHTEPKHVGTWRVSRHFSPSIIGMLLCMGLFFVFVTNFALTEKGLFSIMGITYLMMAVDVIAFFAGMVFGRLMHAMPHMMKYFPPLLFLAGYCLLAYTTGIVGVLVALALIGIANGLGIPYLNTIASIKGGRESVTTVMPIISAALYLGQFVSPIIVGSMASLFPSTDLYAPYKVAILFSVIYLIQVICTRKFHRVE